MIGIFDYSTFLIGTLKVKAIIKNHIKWKRLIINLQIQAKKESTIQPSLNKESKRNLSLTKQSRGKN